MAFRWVHLLSGATVLIARKLSSLTNRSCHVRCARSPRLFAELLFAQNVSMFSSTDDRNHRSGSTRAGMLAMLAADTPSADAVGAQFIAQRRSAAS
jgi:hypothetical protein